MESGHQALAATVHEVTGVRTSRFEALSGGCVAACWRVHLDDGGSVVVKQAGGGENLETEAWMLRYLAAHAPVPVPAVLHAAADVMVLDYVPTSGGIDARVEGDAAENLAALHAVTAPRFGLERDTLIGPLRQPNPPCDDWVEFFRDHRLLYMADLAHEAGRLPADLRARIDGLAARLGDLLPRHPTPSLIHGDVWGGNVLVRDGRLAALIDPAIHYADAEIELAFVTLFGTFGETFFRRYHEIRPIDRLFREERIPLLNLYALLVHVRLFGGGYVEKVSGTLRLFGL
ncbi:MAG: fructosamine kinase family protein [Bauldia litoralis]